MVGHFLVVGAQRCGTTYLHDLLAAHPEIAMARPARPEPKVFLSERPIDVDAYRRGFFGHAEDGQLLGEKSTSYLEVPGVPDRVAATLGAARIVAQLRDPIARAISNWSFSRDHGVEDRPLAEALRSDLASPREWDRTESSVSPYAYVARGRYADDLERWCGRFDVHVQFLEELIEDRDTIGDLYAWLGADGSVRPDVGAAPVNASSTVNDELGDDLVAELRAYYRDSDAALAHLIGREPPWRRKEPT